GARAGGGPPDPAPPAAPAPAAARPAEDRRLPDPALRVCARQPGPFWCGRRGVCWFGWPGRSLRRPGPDKTRGVEDSAPATPFRPPPPSEISDRVDPALSRRSG